MELRQYLEDLKACENKLVEGPDSRKIFALTAEHGVYDNFAILLKARIEQIQALLKDLEKIAGFSAEPGSRMETYMDGLLAVKSFDYLVKDWTTSANPSYGDPEHHARQHSGFDRTLTLHTWHMNQHAVPAAKQYESLRDFIVKIGETAIRESIPLCMPTAKGWNHLEDHSRIVYHTPEQK